MFIAGAAIALSGCGGMQSWMEGRGRDDRSDRPAVVAAISAPAAPASSIAPPPRRAAAAPRVTRPVMPAPVVSIAGLKEDEVVRVMGEPAQRAEREGRRVWTYRGTGCRVEVTFFRDVTRGTYAALAHKVIRADGGATADEGIAGACIQDVRRAAR